MRLLSYKVPKDWNYFLFGDSHIGAALRHDKGFRKMVKMILSPYDGLPARRNKATNHGDDIEAILVTDKRYSSFDTREACVTSQLYESKKELWPIRKHLFCMLNGNHPAKLHNFGPIIHQLAKDLGVSYGTDTAKITFLRSDGSLQLKHLAFHGSGSISSIADDPERRKLNRRLSLKRKLKDLCSDAVLMSMGHTHQILVSEPSRVLYMHDDGESIKSGHTGQGEGEYIHPDYRYYINTGGFLKLYSDNVVESDDVEVDDSKLGSGYAERAGYAPLEIGFVIVKIRNHKIVEVVPEYL